MAGGKASAKKIELEIRRGRALALRLSGETYREIARIIGDEYDMLRYGVGLAHRDVMAGLSAIRADNRERAQQILELELARLDEMMRGVYDKAIGGPFGEPRQEAIDAVLRIMDRRATYLKILLPLEDNRALLSLLMNVNLSELTHEQLVRIAGGEDILTVIADSSQGVAADQERETSSVR